jgi:DNA-binding Lrp family transcriptional regulator
MTKAFVLINVESGMEDQVLNKLKGIEGVEEAYYSYGVYDIISKIQAQTMDKLKDKVIKNIRTLPHVRSTLTLIMVDVE